MEFSRLLGCLAADFDRLREVAARDLTAPVPSCPGWTVTDLVRHVAEVYLDKVECMRLGRSPDNWPPDLTGEEPTESLDRAYAALRGEFAARAPGDSAYTWYQPDQSVGFWIRRMAQETVIHRIDAELGLREEVRPIPEDLALDGADEVLEIFLAYSSQHYADEFGPELKEASGRSVRLTAGPRSWLVTADPTGVRLDSGGTPVATVEAPADAMLRWLWARGGDDRVKVSGATDAVTELRGLLAAVTI
jgi:uncharacterized protein (TIGR03083 family)